MKLIIEYSDSEFTEEMLLSIKEWLLTCKSVNMGTHSIKNIEVLKEVTEWVKHLD